jgi:Cdc6-like AAA superfamily ATPase
MRDELLRLDRELAFQTSARFDLLASDHVPHVELGARDVEGAVERAIAKGEGVIAVTGRMGSGKSSVLAAVTDGLDEGFVPLRVSVVGVEAGSPVAFARHAIQEIVSLPHVSFTKHEARALERAAAREQRVARGRELRAGFEIAAGPALSPKVVADIKTTAQEELALSVDPAAVLTGLQRVYDAFWHVKRCPVLIVDDTDHWGGSPEVADAFFDQTARALERQDAVVVVAAQSDYTALPGYQGVRTRFTAEVALPALPDPLLGLRRILQRRVDSAGVAAQVEDLFADDALRLLASSYAESERDGEAGDMRRTLAVVRNALELAVEEPGAQQVQLGHVQEALARNPLTPGSGLQLLPR